MDIGVLVILLTGPICFVVGLVMQYCIPEVCERFDDFGEAVIDKVCLIFGFEDSEE